MGSPAQLIEDAVAAATRAVHFDSSHQSEPAAYFYRVSGKLLQKAAEVSEPDKAGSLQAKADEYFQRATTLQNQLNEGNKNVQEDENRQRLKRCKFLILQALDADSAGLKDVAVELYTNAIEYVTHYPELLNGDIRDVVLQALERAEELKGRFKLFLKGSRIFHGQ